MLMDIKEHSLTILCGSSLFHIDKSIHVCKHLRENLIHHCVVNLECIGLVVNINPLQQVLIQPEVRTCINNGSPNDHLLIKVQVSARSRGDVGYLDMVSDHIVKGGSPHISHKLEVYHYVLHSLCPVIIINFGCLDVV